MTLLTTKVKTCSCIIVYPTDFSMIVCTAAEMLCSKNHAERRQLSSRWLRGSRELAPVWAYDTVSRPIWHRLLCDPYPAAGQWLLAEPFTLLQQTAQYSNSCIGWLCSVWYHLVQCMSSLDLLLTTVLPMRHMVCTTCSRHRISLRSLNCSSCAVAAAVMMLDYWIFTYARHDVLCGWAGISDGLHQLWRQSTMHIHTCFEFESQTTKDTC